MDSQIARRVAAIGDVVGPDQAAASRDVFASLLHAAQAGRLGRSGLERSYARIQRLKAVAFPHSHP